jgi:hypothetical protein
MKVAWTRHAAERQKEWQRKLGIAVDDVDEVVRNPQQIVPGNRDALVAQSRRGHGLLRVPFVQRDETRKILTRRGKRHGLHQGRLRASKVNVSKATLPKGAPCAASSVSVT